MVFSNLYGIMFVKWDLLVFPLYFCLESPYFSKKKNAYFSVCDFLFTFKSLFLLASMVSQNMCLDFPWRHMENPKWTFWLTQCLHLNAEGQTLVFFSPKLSSGSPSTISWFLPTISFNWKWHPFKCWITIYAWICLLFDLSPWLCISLT